VRILGPAPAPIAKLRGKYRFQLQIQGLDAVALRAAIRRAQEELRPPDDVQWIADVDPLDML
jgi:primosomal protein N' (replication factor Y)